MSDRYRPNGPRSRDFQAGKNAKGSYSKNPNQNQRDLQPPTGPKRQNERDNYRPDQFNRVSSNIASPSLPSGPSASFKPPSGPSSLREKRPLPSEPSRRPLPARQFPSEPNNKRSVPIEPINGVKRQLPAEPSGIRKRREISNNNDYNDSNGFKKYKNSGYTSGYSNNYNGYDDYNEYDNNYIKDNSDYKKDNYGYNNKKDYGYNNKSNDNYGYNNDSYGYNNNKTNNLRSNYKNSKSFDQVKPPSGPRAGIKIIPPGPKGVNKPKKLFPNQIYSVKTTNSIEVYKRIVQVGEGTYGKVYKAKNAITDEYVALKKLRLETEREGFPITAIREIKLLQSFDHENIVGLLEIMVEHNQIYMIFDYLDHDLTGLLSHPDLILEECHKKFIFQNLLDGLNYLHKKRVLHRDIKGSNILLTNIGQVKIADFGLARTMKIVNKGELPDYTNRVITIWYRPPELLLGATDYGREIDIWGVGCLLLELYSKTAAFKGFDEVSQLSKIYNIMGTPTISDWPDINNLPWFEMLKPKVNKLSQFSKKYEDLMTIESFELAKKLLNLNPKNRISAEEALRDEWFQKDPKPEPLHFLKEFKGEWHEFETKKRRRSERKKKEEKRTTGSGNIEVAPNSVSLAPLSASEKDDKLSVGSSPLNLSV